MANYREIKGFTVQSLSTDPSLRSSNAGQVWFNSTTGKLKSLVEVAGWSSGANLITATAYSGGLGPTGTQDAMLVAGTNPPPTNTCQEYNGTGWFTTASMNTARFSMAGGGTTTAAIMAGSGYPSTPTTITEEFDGTSWSEVNNIPVNHVYGAYAGTQTAFFAAGGVAGATTENYDGTSWTASGDMGRPDTSQMNAGMGTQTAGLAAGGTSASATTEEYDGSSWSSGGDLNTGRQYVTGAGTQTAALCIGGFISSPEAYLALTESYDGSAWTTKPAMATNRQAGQGGGTGSAAIAAGGQSSSPIPSWNTTEVFNQSINVVSPAAWSAGGNMTRSPATNAMGGCGTQAAALAYSGYPGSVLTTESYNGTAWAAVNSLNTGRPAAYNNNVGNQGAALMVGCSPSWGNEVESWDGTSWAVSPVSLNYGRGYACSFGSQTAALCAGGYAGPGAQTYVEDWDGTSWTEVGDLGASLYGRGGCGTPAAAVVEGGKPGYNTTVESWNGTAWTAGTAYPTANHLGNMSGIQTDAISMGGNSPGGVLTECNQYDGTNWSTCPSLGTARYGCGTGGTTGSNSLCFGGNTPPQTTATEEFTGEVGTATASNITTS